MNSNKYHDIDPPHTDRFLLADVIEPDKVIDLGVLGPVQGARPGKAKSYKATWRQTEERYTPAPRTAADIMREMAATMEERNGVYKDNWRMVAPMLKILFPDGVPARLVQQDFWHLFELMLVKVARFASTDCTHVDSIHDAGGYCAFIQLAIEEEAAKGSK